MNGVINVLKPPGMTSHDVVAFIRRELRQKKVGHTGTLDPQACGVLPVCVGQATRLADYISGEDKEYLFCLTLGVTTTTQDAWGEETDRKDVSNLSLREIKRVLTTFTGKIEQVAPMYSAVKIDGVPLYRRARRGETVERKARTVIIKELRLLEYKMPHLTLLVNCSKGTYVRTLCHDIGKLLGVGGHLSFLLRTRVGGFMLDDSVTLEEIAEKREKTFIPLINCISGLSCVVLGEGDIARIKFGQSLFLSRDDLKQLNAPVEELSQACATVAAVDLQGRLHALGVLRPENDYICFKPKKVFKME